MQRSNIELWLALLAIALITGFYLLALILLRGVPPASGLLGHSIGILGFILMLMTEVLYSLRKRSQSARWGRMSTWLKFHIFTGLVGPYMVLLHTSWKFNGLAGVVMLLTVVIVLSGFFGRYIYTAVPRTVDGAELAADDLQRLIRQTEAQLAGGMDTQPLIVRQFAEQAAALPAASASMTGLVLGRFFSDLNVRWLGWQVRQKLPPNARPQFDRLERLHLQRRELYREAAALAATRRLLGLWRAVHMPIGMALFTLAFIHMAGAFFYATLLR